MRTIVDIRYAGKPSYRHEMDRRMTEEEVHESVLEGLAGRDPERAEINIYHDIDPIKR